MIKLLHNEKAQVVERSKSKSNGEENGNVANKDPSVAGDNQVSLNRIKLQLFVVL